MKRLLAVVIVIVTVGCAAKPTTLTRGVAHELIEESVAFSAPIDPGVVFIDTKFHPGPDTRRELLRLSAATTKPDGPMGLGGQTATILFTWRWNEGPFAGRVFQSKAKFHWTGELWKVYEDVLRHELWRAERGEEE